MERTTQIQTPQGPRALCDIAGPYVVLRGWKDTSHSGETMMPHLVFSAQNSVEQCQAKMDYIGGGYIARTSDGAIYVDGQWIDDRGDVVSVSPPPRSNGPRPTVLR